MQNPALRDFNRVTLAALARKGISILGSTVIPGAGDFAFATGSRGYILDDNGCQRIRSFSEVLGMAQ